MGMGAARLSRVQATQLFRLCFMLSGLLVGEVKLASAHMFRELLQLQTESVSIEVGDLAAEGIDLGAFQLPKGLLVREKPGMQWIPIDLAYDEFNLMFLTATTYEPGTAFTYASSSRGNWGVGESFTFSVPDGSAGEELIGSMLEISIISSSRVLEPLEIKPPNGSAISALVPFNTSLEVSETSLECRVLDALNESGTCPDHHPMTDSVGEPTVGCWLHDDWSHLVGLSDGHANCSVSSLPEGALVTVVLITSPSPPPLSPPPLPVSPPLSQIPPDPPSPYPTHPPPNFPEIPIASDSSSEDVNIPLIIGVAAGGFVVLIIGIAFSVKLWRSGKCICGDWNCFRKNQILPEVTQDVP